MVATKDTSAFDTSFTAYFLAFDVDRLLLFDPSIALPPSKICRSALGTVTERSTLKPGEFTHSRDAFTAKVAVDAAQARRSLFGCIEEIVALSKPHELFTSCSGVRIEKGTGWYVVNLENQKWSFFKFPTISDRNARAPD